MPHGQHAFLEKIVLGPYLERLPADLHAAYLGRVLTALGDPPVFGFVQLNFVAEDSVP